MKKPLTATLSIGLLALTATGQDQTLLVKAPRIVVAPNVILEDQSLLIRDGVIARVGPEIPEAAKRNATVVEFEGTIVPGFVNPHTHLGLGADLAERISALTPDLKASDAFDPFDEWLLRNARRGVTTLGLAPLSANTFAGMSAVVKAGEIGEVIDDSCYMKIALVNEAFDQQRYPTSRMGAADLIEQSFADARLATTPNDAETAALRNVLSGSTRLAIHARTHGSITAALDLCDELGITPILIGADKADRSAKRIAALGGSVILSGLAMTDSRTALELPAKLHAAGVQLSFMADREPSASAGSSGPAMPPGIPARFRSQFQSAAPAAGPPTPGHPDSLRLSAALAMRHGLPRDAALATLTRTPATQCGVQDSAGSLRQGCAADFAVYSGDPLDLTSRLTAVYVAGQPIDLQGEDQ